MPAGSWAPTPLSISKEGEREKHLEQETRGIEEKMWVGDRALGGGLDTHRSQVERWGGPHQAEGVLTHTDTSGYKQ